VPKSDQWLDLKKEESAMTDAPALLVIGAHPDDCEITAGGIAALTAARGGRVLHLSLTNGDKGHQTLGGAALARIRRDEARAAAAAVGAESIVLDTHDGELMPTLENRYAVIEVMRDFKPDAILFPRPWDYHPDHRYTGTLVQDALYMVRVQNVCPLHDRLASDPVAMYVSDPFQKPYPFQPDVIIDIASVVEQKARALSCHATQMYEWLPFVDADVYGELSEVPADPSERPAFVRRQWDGRLRREAERFRSQLIAAYGSERGAQIAYAEAFEVCELGAPLTLAARERLFPL
jgi:LmbE family N-acetylglucosaminyl deacetylase